MKNTLATVIIPTYNRENFIKDTIESVFAQTYKNWELIIIDDGSNDNTQSIVKSFKDERIRYIWQKNSGLNAARNTGIKNSRGEYISFLDSDDIWEPEKLAKQVEILDKKPDIGLVYCGTSLIDEKNNYIGKKPLITHRGYVLDKLVMYNFLYNGSCVLFRKSCLAKVGFCDETVVRMTDWEFYLRFSIYFKFWGIDKYLLKYRIHQKAMSCDYELFVDSGFKILKRVFQTTDLNPDYLRLINTAYAMRYRYIGKRYFENSEFQRSRGYLKEAVKKDFSMLIKSDALLFYILSWFPIKQINLLKNIKKKITALTSFKTLQIQNKA
jgi:glycosyltransferase involved in cell wall biosynthesis